MNHWTHWREQLAEMPAVFATALRETLARGYRAPDWRADIIAGVSVGVIAVPLAMALAIASGVPPQYGLYTSIVAGAVIALTGGSRINVSGPTAAFVVVLLPIVHKFGLGGLLVATMMAGVIQLAMGLLRLGRLIEFIPYPVTTGFTAGIAVVIATLQVKDFLGLEAAGGEHFVDKVAGIAHALPGFHAADLIVGAVTLTVLLLWPRLKLAFPGHLPALAAGGAVAAGLALLAPEWQAATIGSRFFYETDGAPGHGIPPWPPLLVWPWELPGADGHPVGLSFAMIHALIGPAFAIAMLGAIESLLCAVVADGLAGTKHNPNAELAGQGLGNLIAPFFGGFAATAAIARTAANVRAGARSPVAAVVHAVTVLLAVIAFAGLLSFVPMASLAALLLVVAWHMAEAKHFIHVIRAAPRNDVVVLLTCFFLTVVFDMVLAVGVGVMLAALLFMRRMAELTDAKLVRHEEHPHLDGLPPHIAVYDINGPLFFGAAEKALGVMQRIDKGVRIIILDMGDVSMLDMTAIVAFDSLRKNLRRGGVTLVVSGLAPRLAAKLESAGIRAEPGVLVFCGDMNQARAAVLA